MYDKSKEEWKDVVGYEGLYKVSNCGNVISLDRITTNRWGKYLKKGKTMNQRQDKTGYLKVELTKNKNTKLVSVHRLVAEAFIPNPNNYPCVNHKDENKQNNYIDNLEWCTQKYNVNYGNAIRLRSKKILQYDLNGVFIKEWLNCYEAEKYLKLKKSASNIHKCCMLKSKYICVHNSMWRFKENEDFPKHIEPYINSKLKSVLQYDKYNNFIKEWNSIKEASSCLKIRHSHITDCCKGKLKTCGGYIWKYKG